MKKSFVFLFYLLAGIILGSLVANLCARVPFLSWLAYSGQIGFAANDPACLDLIIVKLYFGFSIAVSVAQIFCIALALSFYSRTRVK